MYWFSDNVVILALPVFPLDENETLYYEASSFAMHHFYDKLGTFSKLKVQAVATILDESSVIGMDK